MANLGASGNNNTGASADNNINYGDWNGFMWGRGAEDKGQDPRPINRCLNTRCNTDNTAMWCKGPLGSKLRKYMTLIS